MLTSAHTWVSHFCLCRMAYQANTPQRPDASPAGSNLSPVVSAVWQQALDQQQAAATNTQPVQSDYWRDYWQHYYSTHTATNAYNDQGRQYGTTRDHRSVNTPSTSAAAQGYPHQYNDPQNQVWSSQPAYTTSPYNEQWGPVNTSKSHTQWQQPTATAAPPTSEAPTGYLYNNEPPSHGEDIDTESVVSVQDSGPDQAGAYDQEDKEDKEEKDSPIPNYKKKLEDAYKQVGLVQPCVKPAYNTSAMLGPVKQGKPIMVLPETKSLKDHFKLAYDGATGEEDYSWGANGTAPQKPVKEGNVSNPVSNVNMAFYSTSNKKNYIHSEYPTGKVVVDTDATTVLSPKREPKFGRIDDWCFLNGKSILVANTMAMFNEAMSVLMSQIEPEEDSELLDTWNKIIGFKDVLSVGIEHLLNLQTNLQTNLIYAKREEYLAACDITPDLKALLLNTPLTDPFHRLFSGKLPEFAEIRSKRQQKQVTNAIVTKNLVTAHVDEPVTKRRKTGPPYKQQKKFTGNQSDQAFLNQDNAKATTKKEGNPPKKSWFRLKDRPRGGYQNRGSQGRQFKSK